MEGIYLLKKKVNTLIVAFTQSKRKLFKVMEEIIDWIIKKAVKEAKKISGVKKYKSPFNILKC